MREENPRLHRQTSVVKDFQNLRPSTPFQAKNAAPIPEISSIPCSDPISTLCWSITSVQSFVVLGFLRILHYFKPQSYHDVPISLNNPARQDLSLAHAAQTKKSRYGSYPLLGALLGLMCKATAQKRKNKSRLKIKGVAMAANRIKMRALAPRRSLWMVASVTNDSGKARPISSFFLKWSDDSLNFLRSSPFRPRE